MEKHKSYDYISEMFRDVQKFVFKNGIDVSGCKEDFRETHTMLYDMMFNADEVTGGKSDAYYADAWDAEEAIAHNWDILWDALDALGNGIEAELSKGVRHCDVLLRQYALPMVIIEFLDDYLEMDAATYDDIRTE